MDVRRPVAGRACLVAALVTALAIGAPAAARSVTPPTAAAHPAPPLLGGVRAGTPGAAGPAAEPAAEPAGDLPICAPAAASRRAPTRPAGPDTPGACRAAAPPVLESADRTETDRTGIDRPVAGYQHLGAGTADEWGGVFGRLAVTDASVRAGTYDFLAARFMVKRQAADGAVTWLEAGWAETGWSGRGRQRIYTYDTVGRTWRFYDAYRLRPGNRVWLTLQGDPFGRWQAWLWWGDRWNLLTAPTLDIGATAQIEQYVELHLDSVAPARVKVPPVAVDNVTLTPPGGGPARPWNAEVATLTGNDTAPRPGGLCLDWATRYDTWSAGTCPATSEQPAERPRTG